MCANSEETFYIDATLTQVESEDDYDAVVLYIYTI